MEARDIRWVAWGALFVFIDFRLQQLDLLPDLIGAAAIAIAAWRGYAQTPVLGSVPLLVILAGLLASLPYFLRPAPPWVAGALTIGAICELIVIVLLGRAIATTGDSRCDRLRTAGHLAVATGAAAMAIGWMVRGNPVSQVMQGPILLLALVALVAAIVWIVTAFQIGAGAPVSEGAMPPLPDAET